MSTRKSPRNHSKRKQNIKYSAEIVSALGTIKKRKSLVARAKDAKRKRLRRANLSTEDLLKLREKEAVQKRKYREKIRNGNEAAVRASESEKKRMRRAVLRYEQLLEVRKRDAKRKRMYRKKMEDDYEKLLEVREKDAERKQLERKSKSTNNPQIELQATLLRKQKSEEEDKLRKR